MAFQLADRVKETSTTTGTGDLTLAGAASGYRTFAAVLSTGDTAWYAIALGTDWEVGLGTLTAATTLQRTTVLASSNGGALTSFGAGSKEVFITVPGGALALLNFAETTLASAATTDIGAPNTEAVAITGTTAITSFGARAGKRRFLRFTGALTLTHNATSLVLQGGNNITTAAGDTALATSDASGNWTVRYFRADGTPLVLPASTQRAGFRNRIINGNFAVNQRGVATAATAYGAGAYTRDRWKAGASGATVAFSDAGTGGLEFTATTTAGTLTQVIEGPPYLAEGATYTLSWSGTAQGRINGGPYASSPITVTGLTAGANATIEFGTGTLGLVQFEPGSVATSFERRDDELRRCQRYYKRFGGSSYYRFAVGLAAAGNYIIVGPYNYGIIMRSTPTLSAAGNFTFVGANQISVTGAGLSLDGGTADFASVAATSVSGASGAYLLQANNDSSAYVAFSAEL